MSDLYWLTDEQMARLSPYFPKSHGKPRVDDRRVLSGIIFVNRNGLRWRDAPREYGPLPLNLISNQALSGVDKFEPVLSGGETNHPEEAVDQLMQQLPLIYVTTKNDRCPQSARPAFRQVWFGRPESPSLSLSAIAIVR